MAIADPVKNFLRTFGHALVSSVHDRLTSIELRLDEASAKLNYLTAGSESNREKMASLSQDLAASDAALLTASIRLVEASKELHALYDGHTDLLARVETLNRTVAHELSKLHAQVNQTADVQASVQAGVHQEYRQSIEALAATQAVCLDRIDATSAKTETVAELVTQLGGIVSNGLVHQVRGDELLRLQ